MLLSIDAIFRSDNFEKFLKTMSKEYYYSLVNQMLIFSQFPDNTAIAGEQAWNKLGATVKDDAKGISVMKYNNELKKELVLVFDKTQTDYEPTHYEFNIEERVKLALNYTITYDAQLNQNYKVIEEEEEIIVKDTSDAISYILSAYVDMIFIDEDFRDKCLKKCLNYCLNYYFGYEIKESFVFIHTIQDKKQFLLDLHEHFLRIIEDLIGMQLSFEEVNIFNLLATPNREEFVNKLREQNMDDKIFEEMADKFMLLNDYEYKKMYSQIPIMSYPLTTLDF